VITLVGVGLLVERGKKSFVVVLEGAEYDIIPPPIGD
jgi:hypothetical protein